MENNFWNHNLVPIGERPLDFFTLSEVEKNHVKTKYNTNNQLIYAACLKYFENQGQFPANLEALQSIRPDIYRSMANQLHVPFLQFISYPSERTCKRFRASIREFLGYSEMTSVHKKSLATWLFENILPYAPDEDELLGATEFFCRTHKLELGSIKEMKRFIMSVAREFEQKLLNQVYESISCNTQKALDQILEISLQDKDLSDESELFSLNDLKKDLAYLKKDSIMHEVAKYKFLKELEIQQTIYEKYPRKLILKYVSYVKSRLPSDLIAQTNLLKYSQLMLFCAFKTEQSADTLTDFLIKILKRIDKKAQRYVDQYMLSEIKKVKGKFNTLLTLAETLKDNPRGIIEEAIYPKVPKEELEAIVKDLYHKEKWFKNQVRVKALSLYSHGYRKTLKELLNTLTFETDRKDLKELILAAQWIKQDKFLQDIKEFPYKQTILKSWGPMLQKQAHNEQEIVVDPRAYELAILEHFAKELTVKNIWVKGS